jgi:SAM-dependent methyltransferase
MDKDLEQSLVGEVKDIWNQNAAFWDDYMGEGNDFQRLLVRPALERLLELKQDECVLEVACGNGSFARRLAELGARVVACDISDVFIARARDKTLRQADRIAYHVVDAADYDQLLALGRQRFEAVVCNMALMDMPVIDPLLRAIKDLLKPGGRFVFSIMHPCFNTIGIRKVVEEEDVEGELISRYAVKISAYIDPVTRKGLGVVGQPAPHYYFHRPLSVLLNSCFRAGLVIDGLEEPVFETEIDGKRPLSWVNFKKIPPVLVVRLRRLN